MSDDSLVSAAEIARLAGVGRAAVSNWRRRYPDFPEPVAESGAAPAFRGDEVRRWLRDQGKLVGERAVDILWRLLEATRGERETTEAVAAIAEYLADPSDGRGLDPQVRDGVRDLAETHDPGELVEALCSQLFERQQRQHLATPPELARLLVELADPAGGTVLDPACGPGNLLRMAAEQGATRLIGQEVNAELARLAAARLAVAAGDAEISAGDSLRADAYPELRVDAVVCDPPFGYRDWGYEELGVDPRWQYGVPVKGEPELAWLQHCLARTKPGGTVALALPASVAFRRPGRAIRQALVRHGAFRAVIALPPGVLRSTGVPIHLWVLRNPTGAGAGPILLVDASHHQPRRRGQVNWSALRQAVLEPWRAFAASGEIEPVVGRHQVIEPIELLDEEVDLTPARHLPQPETEVDAGELNAAGRSLAETLAGLGSLLPTLSGDTARSRPVTTINDLARADALTIQRSLGRMDLDEDGATTGPLVLTGRDVATGVEPSARLESGTDSGVTELRPGDLVVPMVAAGDGRASARVIDKPGMVLGPNLQLVRADPQRVDAEFLAGHLRSTGAARTGSTLSGVHRLDVRRVEVPVLDIDSQRELGEVFRKLAEFESALRRAHRTGTDLANQLTDALATGAASTP